MGRKHAFATKADLERLVLRMLKTGILYSEAIREFKKQFIVAALRTAHWNQSQAARVLGMHRNTLVRTVRALDIDIRALRNGERRPPQSSPVLQRKKVAG